MLLRNGNVKEAFRKFLPEFLEACTAAHSRCDTHNLWIMLCNFHNFFAEYSRPAGFTALGKRFPCPQIKGADAMVIPRTFFRIRIPPAFFCFHMDKNGPMHLLHILKQFDQFRQIMSIHRANILKAHAFKYSTFQQQQLCAVPYLFQYGISRFPNDRYHITNLFEIFFKCLIPIAGAQGIQMFADGTHIGINGHLVIIQNNNQVSIFSACVIQRFIGQTACHGTIANDSNDMVFSALQISCFCNTQSR